MSGTDDCVPGVDCDEVLKEVQLFLDRELSQSERVRIEVHLAECTSCFDRAEFRQKLKELLARKCGREPLPEALAGRIRAVLGHHPH